MTEFIRNHGKYRHSCNASAPLGRYSLISCPVTLFSHHLEKRYGMLQFCLACALLTVQKILEYVWVYASIHGQDNLCSPGKFPWKKEEGERQRCPCPSWMSEVQAEAAKKLSSAQKAPVSSTLWVTRFECGWTNLNVSDQNWTYNGGECILICAWISGETKTVPRGHAR